MGVTNHTGRTVQYATWYEFKKDLENQLGRNLLNWHWLEVKPQAPLPWDDSHLRAALSSSLFSRDKARTSRQRRQRLSARAVEDHLVHAGSVG